MLHIWFLANFDEVLIRLRPCTAQTGELPRPRLDKQFKMSHPLIRLASLMNWAEIEHSFGAHFTSSRGLPALCPRLVAGLLYLQHANDASDEAVVATWLENPYWHTSTAKPGYKQSCP